MIGMRKLVLMTDYGADPVWENSSGSMVDLDRLPLTDATRMSLRRWAERWERQATAEIGNEREDPATWAWFDDEGRRLWEVTRRELAPHGFVVGYAVTVPEADTVLVEWTAGADPERPAWFGTDPAA